MQFKIIRMTTERTPNGYTTIVAHSIEDKIIEVEIKISNVRINDKDYIKDTLMKRYNLLNDERCDNIIKVGDVL